MTAPDPRTEATIAEVSYKIQLVEDAHVTIDILLRAICHITENGADFVRNQDGAGRFSALPHLDMALGLTNIADEYLQRAIVARAAADDALFAKREPAA